MDDEGLGPHRLYKSVILKEGDVPRNSSTSSSVFPAASFIERLPSYSIFSFRVIVSLLIIRGERAAQGEYTAPPRKARVGPCFLPPLTSLC